MTAAKKSSRSSLRRKVRRSRPAPFGLQAVYAFVDGDLSSEDLAREFAGVPERLLRLEPHSFAEAAVFKEVTDRYFPGGTFGPDDDAPASTDLDHSRRVAYLIGVAVGWHLTSKLRDGAK